AFRFTLAALAAQGRDIRLSENRIEGYRNFVNKLWNSARFTLPHCDKLTPGNDLQNFSDFSLPERWLLSRLNKTTDTVRKALESYSFNEAAQALYEFSWHEFCDWGLEISKIPLGDHNTNVSRRSATVLIHTLDSLLRLLHPFIPFITEEISSKLSPSAGPIIRGQYPVPNQSLIDERSERDMQFLMSLITSVRNLRAEMNVSPGKTLPVILGCASTEQVDLVRLNLPMVLNLARISNLDFYELTPNSVPPRECVTAVVSGAIVYIPLHGIVDPDVEVARLNRELAKIRSEYESVQKKLNNEDFLSKAKPEAIKKQQDRQTELSSKLIGLKGALEKMISMKNV
ncbi:MAG: class I tRNA ligase family protein, partial [Desulfomonilaceae bacterium]